MSDQALHQQSLVALRANLASKQLSATDVAQHFLQRAQADTHHAFLAFNEDATLRQATAAQQRIDAGDTSPLLGLPIAHKDIFVTRDFPTTAGSRILEGYRSPFDATVVQRLADAGMVTIGKLSCDEFAMGSANENVAVPASKPQAVTNPWDVSRIPGGSSGGSAAAVAAGLAPAAGSVAGALRRSINSRATAMYAWAPTLATSYTTMGFPKLGASARRMFRGITVEKTRSPK
jgi:aspartyl-tRNA(Asn)/glutamyl-tRNA(Gln) amidotransferase subunit A